MNIFHPKTPRNRYDSTDDCSPMCPSIKCLRKILRFSFCTLKDFLLKDKKQRWRKEENVYDVPSQQFLRFPKSVFLSSLTIPHLIIRIRTLRLTPKGKMLFRGVCCKQEGPPLSSMVISWLPAFITQICLIIIQSTF